MSILSDIPLNNFSVYWIRCKWHTNSGARKSHRGLFVVKVNKEDLC